MRASGAWSALFAVCSVCSAAAQDDPAAKMLYPEGLREDLGIIRQTVEQAHPDPYRYRTKSEIDTLFRNVATSFKAPIGTEAFIAATLPIFRAIGDAGTLLAPPSVLQQKYEHSEPLLPITVAVLGGRLYLDAELKGFRSLPSGCELLSINERPAKEILAQLRASVVADGADTTWRDRRIEQDFPLLYRRFVEKADRFKVRFRTVEGSTDERDVFAMTKDEMRQTYTPKGYALDPWRLEEMPELHTAWLTLGTLDRTGLEKQRINPERFLNDVLAALQKDDTGTLVIDVRGAGGADLGMAGQVFALIAREPYRVVRSMSIRSGEVPDSYSYAEPAPNFFASVGSMYLPEANGRRELKADDPRLMAQLPLAKAYKGKVYVVANGLTTGAGAAFVMLAKRSGRARTVGEETGSNAASFCGGQMLAVTLPNSGCVLHVPLTRFVPDGMPSGPTDRGELPASPVARLPRDVAQGKDTVRNALLQLIFELQ